MSKYSPWFPHDIFPVHNGVYEISPAQGVFEPHPHAYYRYFDGVQWMIGSRSVNSAAKETAYAEYVAPWRGLSRKPK